VAALPKNLQTILLEAALEGDSAEAQKKFVKDDFSRQVVNARRVIATRNAGWLGCWKVLGPEEYLTHIALRENLLGGRVKMGLLGAADRVDRAILDVLTAKDLLAEALLTGLEFVVGEGGKYLSGGQRQKTAIARVLLKNPTILLLDEATAALDEVSQARITEMVRREFVGRTVLSISHRLSTIRHCDRIIVLDHGQVAQEGTYEELVSREGIFHELVQQDHDHGEETQPAGRGDSPTSGTEPRSLMGREGLSLRRQLTQCPLFAKMTSANIAFLERVAKEVHCAQGEVIFRQGDPGNEFYLILAGEVDFFVERQTPDTLSREVVDTYGPGGSFGELALFGTGRRALGAVARTALHLCVLEREDLLRLLAADPQIAVALLKAFAIREAKKTARLYQVPLKNEG